MSINLSALMKQRYDTAANWTAQNPTLLSGEIGIESDTKKWKVGTGSTAWTSLTYAIGGTYPIVNADIAAGAAIAYSKLATLSSGNIVLGSAANVATSTAVTGDVTISSTGVTAIASGVIVNADINASAAIVDTKLATIATAGKVSNSATTATNANTASAIVARDASGNFSAGTITAALTGTASGNLVSGGALGTPSSGTLTNCTFPTLNQNTTGNAATVTTNANLTGDVTSVGNATAIAAGVIVDADVNASAAIVDTKLATIATAGKVSNSATTAASANTASAIVARDASGNFTAGTITAALTGAASANVLKAGDTMTGVLAVTAGTAALPGIAVSGDLNTGIYSPGADQIGISTGGTSRIVVDASGNVNIDSGTFYVDGAIIFTASSGSVTLSNTDTALLPDGGFGQYLRMGNTYGSGKTYITFTYNGTQIGLISANSTSSVSYSTSSDYRLKENVRPITGAAARILQLKPSRFNFIPDPDQTVDGFLAHEVQAVVPEAIHGEKDAVDADGNPVMQGIDQSKLVPLLTAALQEAIAKIEALETRLSALEGA